MRQKRGALGVISMAILVLVSQAAFAGDLDGDWNFVFKTEVGDKTPTLTLITEGETVKAEAEGIDLAGTFKDGELELKGELFSPDAGYTSTLTVTGKLDGEALAGEWVWDVYTGPFTATRAE